jgi:HPt (histidine-containing phosphotransfer) domain-containing protein
MRDEERSGADGAVAAAPPFDGRPPDAERTRAAAMARFEGDDVFYARIVPLFRQAVSDQSRGLLEAVRARDAAKITHWSHSLKGSLLTVGAIEVAERAEFIEAAAGAARLDGLALRAVRLIAEAAVIVEQLDPAAPAA